LDLQCYMSWSFSFAQPLREISKCFCMFVISLEDSW
jgi:hypothetical protein